MKSYPGIFISEILQKITVQVSTVHKTPPKKSCIRPSCIELKNQNFCVCLFFEKNLMVVFTNTCCDFVFYGSSDIVHTNGNF
jgi:hypothetical protein